MRATSWSRPKRRRRICWPSSRRARRFEKLAKDKSTDKASGAEGGDLGWFKRTDMVKEFADAAFALKKGELSEAPVKTQFGYHVIKVEDRRQAPPPAFEEMAEQIREELARETVTAFIDQLRSGAKIEKFNIDGSQARSGGGQAGDAGCRRRAGTRGTAPPSKTHVLRCFWCSLRRSAAGPKTRRAARGNECP